jgi:tetratricopeptide (TPR) repeat protein
VALILVLVYFAGTLDFSKYKSSILTSSSIVILVLGVLTIVRNKDWKDNDSLFLSADDKPGTVVYVNLANIYAKKQQFDIAEKYYRKALDLRDELVLANNNLGKVLIVEGKLDSAYYYVKKAKMLDTLSPEPRLTLAQLYANKNMFPDAITELEELQRISPGGYMNSAEMLADLKRRLNTDSSGIISQKPKLNADKIIQLEQESYQKFTGKDYDSAISELLQLIQLNPASSATYYNNIGMCYQSQNKPEDAKKYFGMAVKADSKFSTAYNNLGMVYESMGDKENARKNFKSAMDADPKNKSAADNYNRLK